jgi:hypothetical protein
MSKTGLAAALHALATDTKGRPETARLRDVFCDVEAALAAGVSHAAVLQALHDQGYKMTMASFRSALYRIRKERAGKPATPARSTPAAPSVVPAAEPEPDESAGGGSHKPEDLDAIIGSKPDLDALANFVKKRKK